MEVSNLTWSILVIFSTVITINVSVVYLLDVKYDDREPPAIRHPIPYVGHLLGLVWWGQHYFERIRYSFLRQHDQTWH